MTDLQLDIAFWNYDRTRALTEEKVRISGVDAKYHSGSNVSEIFRGMVAEHRFDVAELGLTYFLRTFKEGESPFLAIPVFPVRAFRFGHWTVHRITWRRVSQGYSQLAT